jgi:hypothetical protein
VSASVRASCLICRIGLHSQSCDAPEPCLYPALKSANIPPHPARRHLLTTTRLLHFSSWWIHSYRAQLVLLLPLARHSPRQRHHRPTLTPPPKSANWPITRLRLCRPWGIGHSNRPSVCTSRPGWVGWTMTVGRGKTPQVTRASKTRSFHHRPHIPWSARPTASDRRP